MCLITFVFLSHAACCSAVAAGASGVNSAKTGLTAIVMTAGKSSMGAASVVLPGKLAHASSGTRNPSRPCRP